MRLAAPWTDSYPVAEFWFIWSDKLGLPEYSTVYITLEGYQVSADIPSFDPAEHVYVENEWYDGPRVGIANLSGQPHRFISRYDHSEDDLLGTYDVWPIDQKELKLEREQWQIFVEWNARYESGESTVDSHPGHGGISARWDAIEKILRSKRTHIPGDALRARAELVHIEQELRYGLTGPSYMLRWKLL